MIQRCLAILLIIGLTFTSVNAQSGLPTLQQAISTGQARARFSGTGSSSGDSVMVEVSKGPKAAAGPLTVSVPSGSMLGSSDASAQGMMILEVAGRDTGTGGYAPERNITIPASGSATYVLSAFCAEFHKDNPSSGTHFTLRQPDPKLACIARQSLNAQLSIEATQAAVWIYTDGLTYDQMNEKFNVSRSDWDKARRIVAACGVVTR